MKMPPCRLALLASSIAVLANCGNPYPETVVHIAKNSGLDYEVPTVADAGKFLNDLMLSPYWNVERGRHHGLRATARAVSAQFGYSSADSSERFLFELAPSDWSIPEDYEISNEHLRGGEGYFYMEVAIFFQAPRVLNKMALYRNGEPFNLKISEFHGDQISANSKSFLAFKLSEEEPIYLVIRESGEDPSRKLTFEKAHLVLKEIGRIAELPKKYSNRETYLEFFRMMFGDLSQEKSIKRKAGMQDRDTFYGYFKSENGVKYDKVNVRISHPKYCGGECTRRRNRLDKGEFLGEPYVEGDLLFFQIEDNAVYLSKHEYDQRFGTFSGSGSFEGTLEILNGGGELLYVGKDQFKGWER